MSLTLLIDCVRHRPLVALLAGATTVAERRLDRAADDARGRVVYGAAAALLAGRGVLWSHLDAVAAAVGPGPVTGTRVSIAAAQGIALARDIAAVALPAWFGYADRERRGECQTIAVSLAAQGSAVAEIVVADGGWRWSNACWVPEPTPAADPDADSVAAALAVAPRLAPEALQPIYLRRPDVRPQTDARGRPLGVSV